MVQMDQSEGRIFTFHSGDVTQNPKRLVPSVMGFVRVRVCARAGSQARGDRDFFCARVKKGFFGGF